MPYQYTPRTDKPLCNTHNQHTTSNMPE